MQKGGKPAGSNFSKTLCPLQVESYLNELDEIEIDFKIS